MCLTHLANYQISIKGKNHLKKCIKADNENIEIRYLRFTIQTNVPAFLGYSNSIFG